MTRVKGRDGDWIQDLGTAGGHDPERFTGGGLPVGVEFLGRPFAEGRLFTIAYGYEQATRRRLPPSTTPALPGEP